VEIDLDHGDAVERLRLGVVDVIDRRGHVALELHHNSVAELLRRKARIVPDNGHDGDIDIREDIDWRPLDDYWPQKEQQQRQHYECVRSPKRETDNPHQITFGRELRRHSPGGTRIDCSSGSCDEKIWVS
jgi:hypothetical protein